MAEPLKIFRARWTYVDQAGALTDAGGAPVLVIHFVDGRVGRVYFPCKMLFYGFPAVAIDGTGFDQLPPVDFPGDEALGLPATRLDGFVQDPDVVALAHGFDNAVRLGNFIPIAEIE